MEVTEGSEDPPMLTARGGQVRNEGLRVPLVSGGAGGMLALVSPRQGLQPSVQNTRVTWVPLGQVSKREF